MVAVPLTHADATDGSDKRWWNESPKTKHESLDWFCWQNLEETMVFTIKYRAFRLKCSHHPILWMNINEPHIMWSGYLVLATEVSPHNSRPSAELSTGVEISQGTNLHPQYQICGMLVFQYILVYSSMFQCSGLRQRLDSYSYPPQVVAPWDWPIVELLQLLRSSHPCRPTWRVNVPSTGGAGDFQPLRILTIQYNSSVYLYWLYWLICCIRSLVLI